MLFMDKKIIPYRNYFEVLLSILFLFFSLNILKQLNLISRQLVVQLMNVVGQSLIKTNDKTPFSFVLKLFNTYNKIYSSVK
jgi:hypothetical protein